MNKMNKRFNKVISTIVTGTTIIWSVGVGSLVPFISVHAFAVNTAASVPANGATGVPISTIPRVTFDQNVDQDTLTPANITLTRTSGSSTVGASIRRGPNFAELVPSSTPTLVSSSRFARLTNVGTGTTSRTALFPITTGSITPLNLGVTNAYSSPSVGDIVYFQNGDFPAEVGIVTNATLTAGTFEVNGFPLFGTQQITRVATPAAEGLATDLSANDTAGDLVVVNMDGRYNWYMVTSDGVPSNLRLNDSGSEPTFVSGSRFAKVTPAETASVAPASAVTINLTGDEGGLLYANVTNSSGADNSGSYAWHIITTGENISGTAPSALRLDGKDAAPTFASGSRISRWAPGDLASDVQTATNVPFFTGDIVFASTTAGAANNGSFNFHIVSSAGSNNGPSSAPNLRFDNATSALTTETQYRIRVTGGASGVRQLDDARTQLSGDVDITFTTGATGATDTTPPQVASSIPDRGNQSFPTGVSPKVVFSVGMNTTGGADGANSVTNPSNVFIALDTFGAAGTRIEANNSYDSTTKTVTIAPTSPLTINTNYVIVVAAGVQSSSNQPVQTAPPIPFRTGASADTTKPRVLGIFPNTGASSIARNLADIAIGFSEDMDPSTMNGSNITVTRPGPVSLSGEVTYTASDRTAHFSPTEALASNITYTVTVATTATDLTGNVLDQDTTTGGNQPFTSTFTSVSGSADGTAPSVSSAQADNFSIAVTFNEAMKRTSGAPDSVLTIQNYTIESPLGASVSLAGKTVTYNASTMTATIAGLTLGNGTPFKVIVRNVKDLNENLISVSGTPAANEAYGTVANASATGGQLGPGTGVQQDAKDHGMSPIRVTPTVRASGATSNYAVEFPVSTSIPNGGSIVLTFPSGFTVSGTTAVSTTNSPRNADINGPGSGTVGIQSVSASGNVVTIVTNTAETGAPSFIGFDLAGIVNSTLPNSSGYTIDIKTRSTTNNTILQSMTSAPFTLGASGSNTLTVNLFKDLDGNSTNDGGAEAISGVTVFLFSPASGGQSTTTSAGGVATFSNVASGDYELGYMPPTGGGFAANTAPQRITISGNLTRNIIIGSGAGAATTLTIAGTVAGPNGTSVDVFGASPTGFTRTTLTLTGPGSPVSYSLPVQANTTYKVGVGPAMPDSSFIPGAPPPTPPTFTFMPPAPVDVTVASSNVTGQNFTLSSADRTITGTVRDSQGNAINGAMVDARPVSSSTDTRGEQGAFGTTNSSGAFSLNVNAGTFSVSVFKPGMPGTPDQQITVPASGATTPSTLAFVIAADTTALTISGTVKDGDGNAIAYSGVQARKVTSTSDTSFLKGGMDNMVGGPTDTNGQYTLYVGAGTWVVEAFAPGFGLLGTKTVTISSSSSTGQNFSTGTLNLGTITGNATRASTGVQGVQVRIEGASGRNFGVTDSTGMYSIKAPAGTYSIFCFFPNNGEAAPVTGIVVTSNATTSSGTDCTIGAVITLTVNLTDGTNALTGGFVDVKDSNGRGNGTSVSTTSGVNAVYTVSVPPGTYTVRAGHPAYGPLGETANVTATGSHTYSAVSTGQRYTVSGTVLAGGSAVNGAWVSVTGAASGKTKPINMGAPTNASGAFSISIPSGTYSLRADKPGYVSGAAQTITVSGGNLTGQALTLTTASRTITGTVRLNGIAVANAFVDASDGAGGFVVTKANPSGVFTLDIDSANKTWTVKGRTNGADGSAAVAVSGASTSQDLSLTAVSGYIATSPTQASITPTSGGLLANSDIGASFKVSIPPNGLGTESNPATVTTQSTTAVPTHPTGTLFAKNAVNISAVSASGGPVTTLTDSATIVVPYTPGDLPSGASEENIALGVWNDATSAYDQLTTTIDAVNNTATATTTHFSTFVPMVFTTAQSGARRDATPPAAPTLVKATSDGTSVTLTWKDPTDSDLREIEILRNNDLGGPVSGTPVAVAARGAQTYKDTSVMAGKTYKYAVRSVDSAANFTISETVSVEVKAAAVSTPVTPAPTPTPTPTQPVTPPAKTTTPAPKPAPTAIDRAEQVQRILTQAKELLTASPDQLAERVGKTRSVKVESDADKLVAKVVGKALRTAARDIVKNFVAYGTPESEKLGAGERAGVVNSFKAAFGKDPETEADFEDVLKIGAGRFPSQKNVARESLVEATFMEIYKRAPNRANANDDAAITIMAYGLRTGARNIASERAAIGSFRSIFKKVPLSASDWDALRAIAYSGATR